MCNDIIIKSISFQPSFFTPVLHFNTGDISELTFYKCLQIRGQENRVGLSAQADFFFYSTLALPIFNLFINLLQVSWLKRHGEKLDLLTWGPQIYAKDERYEITYLKPNNWQLKIKFVNERDEGHYECQISSHPPLVKSVYLMVVGEY